MEGGNRQSSPPRRGAKLRTPPPAPAPGSPRCRRGALAGAAGLSAAGWAHAPRRCAWEKRGTAAGDAFFPKRPDGTSPLIGHWPGGGEGGNVVGCVLFHRPRGEEVRARIAGMLVTLFLFTARCGGGGASQGFAMPLAKTEQIGPPSTVYCTPALTRGTHLCMSANPLSVSPYTSTNSCSRTDDTTLGSTPTAPATASPNSIAVAGPWEVTTRAPSSMTTRVVPRLVSPRVSPTDGYHVAVGGSSPCAARTTGGDAQMAPIHLPAADWGRSVP